MAKKKNVPAFFRSHHYPPFADIFKAGYGVLRPCHLIPGYLNLRIFCQLKDPEFLCVAFSHLAKEKGLSDSIAEPTKSLNDLQCSHDAKRKADHILDRKRQKF
ncbi:hypothetical protein ES705_12934 [subsurface metagenome]